MHGWNQLRTDVLPQLVLAVEFSWRGQIPSPEDVKPPFNEERTWHPVLHTTAGNGCQSHYLWATLLKPHPECEEGFVQLSRTYKGSLLGWEATGSPSLDELIAYRESIRSLVHPECDCNFSYQDLEEAFYPFDLNSLRLLTAEVLPDLNELENVLLQPKPKDVSYSASDAWLPQWKLLLLGHNSD